MQAVHIPRIVVGQKQQQTPASNDERYPDSCYAYRTRVDGPTIDSVLSLSLFRVLYVLTRFMRGMVSVTAETFAFPRASRRGLPSSIIPHGSGMSQWRVDTWA